MKIYTKYSPFISPTARKTVSLCGVLLLIYEVNCVVVFFLVML